LLFGSFVLFFLDFISSSLLKSSSSSEEEEEGEEEEGEEGEEEGERNFFRLDIFVEIKNKSVNFKVSHLS
jgi:hypothetical protein